MIFQKIYVPKGISIHESFKKVKAKIDYVTWLHNACFRAQRIYIDRYWSITDISESKYQSMLLISDNIKTSDAWGDL